MDIHHIVGRPRRFFVWRIGGFCSLVVRRLFCMCSLSQLVFGGIARRLGMCFSFLGRIGTSRRSLLRGGFFVVDVLVVVCGCGGRIIRSIDRSKLHDRVGFGLAYSCVGLKDK